MSNANRDKGTLPLLRVAVILGVSPSHFFGGLGTHVAAITSAIAGRVMCDLFIPANTDYRPLHRNVHLNMIPTEHAESNLEILGQLLSECRISCGPGGSSGGCFALP